MKKQIKNVEIDLIGLLIHFWNNKSKITVIVIISVFLSLILHLAFKPMLKAKTEIVPITIFENNLYSSYNSYLIHDKLNKTALNNSLNENQVENSYNKNLPLDYFREINIDYLLSLFVEELGTKEIIKEAIKKYQILDPKKYVNEEKYLDAVEKKALKLKLLLLSDEKNKRINTRLSWIIEFEIYEKKKWEEALNFIESKINSNVREYLKIGFNTALDNLKLIKKFEIEDLDLKIKNIREEYDTQQSIRLAFLREQALIARELNIEKNTLAIENFDLLSGVISSVKSVEDYYMRGYSMIEKEIKLIETRTNKDAFTDNLYDIIYERRDLIENKSLERIEELFNSTPIFSENNFKAAKIVYKNTKYHTPLSMSKAILLGVILGIIFGIFYVLINTSIQHRKN